MNNEFKNLDMDFLENKIVNAVDLVDMIVAQAKDEKNKDTINFASRIIDLIYSHSIYVPKK